MGGFAFFGSDMGGIPTVEESLVDLSTNPRVVAEVPHFATLTYIMEHFPQIITDTHEETILDRAESSSLSKALLVVQVAWFCTNCASRLIQRLPLSLLEVSTAAHAFCTLLTYFVWWSKPTNIATPTIMRGKEAREVYALLMCSDEEYKEALEMALEMAPKRAEGYPARSTGTEKIILAANALQHLLPNPPEPPERRFLQHTPNVIPGAFRRESASDGVYMLIAVAVSPALYGVIHFLAWNDHFPTSLEHVLWRVSSVMVTCSGIVWIPLTGVIGYWYFIRSNMLNRMSVGPGTMSVGRRRIPGSTICILSPALMAHVMASGFLIVESLRQLFFLEPAAYQLPSWTNYWPHLS